jgi:hypothetical protein
LRVGVGVPSRGRRYWVPRVIDEDISEAVVKTGLIVLGGALALMGSVFTLQGLGYVGGSSMTGETLWAIVGPIVAVVGIVLIVLGVRRGKPSHGA